MNKKMFFAKILSVVFAVIFGFAVSSGAWTLSWDESEAADGYKVYYNDINTPDTVVDVDVGNVTSFDLDSAGLIEDTRYEFRCTAYNSEGESAYSDTLRWTMARAPIIIEMLGAPVSIIINP